MKRWIEDNIPMALLAAGGLLVVVFVLFWLFIIRPAEGVGGDGTLPPDASDPSTSTLRIRDLGGCDEVGALASDFIVGKSPGTLTASLKSETDDNIVLHECVWRFPEPPSSEDQPRGSTFIRLWDTQYTLHTRDSFIETWEAASAEDEHSYLIESGQLSGRFGDIVVTKNARMGLLQSSETLALYYYQLYIWNKELPTAVTKVVIDSDHGATNSAHPEALPEDPGDERAVEVLLSFLEEGS